MTDRPEPRSAPDEPPAGHRGALSRIRPRAASDLARGTGLSRATVSTLVEELVRAGLVEEHEAADERAPAADRAPAGAAVARAGRGVRRRARLRPQHIRVAVCDLVGRAGRRRLVAGGGRPRADREPRPRARARARGAARAPASRPTGCSASAWASRRRSTGAPASSRPTASSPAGTGSARPPRWRRGSGLPVQLENDANVGALGEKVFGAARGVDDLVYIRLSAGIGAGLILDGRSPTAASAASPARSATSSSDPSGPICRCGNRGCLETVASPVAVAALLERSLGRPVSVAAPARARRRGRPRRPPRGGRRRRSGRTSGRRRWSTSSTPSWSSSAATSPRPGRCCSTRSRRRSSATPWRPAAAAVRVIPGTLGERAEVLGAAALILADAPRALVHRLEAR